jgi:transcriptional regulator GlxA family with amidase domain
VCCSPRVFYRVPPATHIYAVMLNSCTILRPHVMTEYHDYVLRHGMSTVQEIQKRLFLQPLPNLVAKLRYSRRLERAWQSIEKDYADPALNLQKVAKTCGISKNHLNVLFRQATGFTVHQLLIRYRLSSAVTLMSTKNYSLLEIALQSGFGSLSAFERNFRKVIGLPPLHLRRIGIYAEENGISDETQEPSS